MLSWSEISHYMNWLGDGGGEVTVIVKSSYIGLLFLHTCSLVGLWMVSMQTPSGHSCFPSAICIWNSIPSTAHTFKHCVDPPPTLLELPPNTPTLVPLPPPPVEFCSNCWAYHTTTTITHAILSPYGTACWLTLWMSCWGTLQWII